VCIAYNVLWTCGHIHGDGYGFWVGSIPLGFGWVGGLDLVSNTQHPTCFVGLAGCIWTHTHFLHPCKSSVHPLLTPPHVTHTPTTPSPTQQPQPNPLQQHTTTPNRAQCVQNSFTPHTPKPNNHNLTPQHHTTPHHTTQGAVRAEVGAAGPGLQREGGGPDPDPQAQARGGGQEARRAHRLALCLI
jgi:hypothetical protein